MEQITKHLEGIFNGHIAASTHGMSSSTRPLRRLPYFHMPRLSTLLILGIML